MDRRIFLKALGLGSLAFATGCFRTNHGNSNKHPNIILIMADDLGYGDLACYGNPIVKTPHLDAMAEQGIKFERFYSAAPVCSPTRGSCLTGRHPYRYSIKWAGRYALPTEEITIAEALKTKGYATGHFGKWHLGGLSKTVNQSEFPGGPSPYSPPWENGFDECFSTESMMPTYNPYYHVGGDFGSEDYRHVQKEPVAKGQKTGGFRWRDNYWTGPGQFTDEWLEGDDSEIIMDKALDFIIRKSADKKPFFSAIWFHTPHTPVVAGNNQRTKYPERSIQEQHWFGSISAMDEQVGRLREKLQELNIAENTIVWFCSDNGPSYIHNFNSAGGLRGKKAELYEGGIRVPAILEWPNKIHKHSVSQLPAFTSDFYPTILSICGIQMNNQPPTDGQNIIDLILSDKSERTKPLLFQSPLPNKLKKFRSEKSQQYAMIGNRYKIISMDDGRNYELYDLINDPSEKNDLATDKPAIVQRMKSVLGEWIKSCSISADGLDYK